LPGLKPSKTGFDIDNHLKNRSALTLTSTAQPVKNRLNTAQPVKNLPKPAQPVENRFKTGFDIDKHCTTGQKPVQNRL
jgi:hypothetical protein